MSSLVGLIHGNQAFISYQFKWNNFPVFLSIIPWIYMIPTAFLISRIFYIYQKLKGTKSGDSMINPHLFRVLCWSLFTSYLFFLFDFLMIRLPATGIFTSFCASVQPNHFLKLIFMATFYINYSAMILPLMLSLIRLIIMIFPNRHSKINEKLLQIAIPSIFIYPILFTFFLIPALGVCKTMAFPYPFGSIGIFYIDSLWEMHQSHLYLWNTIFWLFCSVIINLALLGKLIHVKSKILKSSRSGHSYKAEFSLTLTISVMFLFYVTNCGFGFAYVMYDMSSNYNSWATMFRPLGNDLVTVVVPIVFYFTHPVFRKEDVKVFSWLGTRRKSSSKGSKIIKISPSNSGSF